MVDVIAYHRQELVNGGQKELTHVSQAALHQTYGAYDCQSSGISPATLMRINRRLDIFTPTQMGRIFIYW